MVVINFLTLKELVGYNTQVRETRMRFLHAGVWLSLARVPGLGPGGRRFESCHPDAHIFYSKNCDKKC